jgi:hypothetical protein
MFFSRSSLILAPKGVSALSKKPRQDEDKEDMTLSILRLLARQLLKTP